MYLCGVSKVTYISFITDKLNIGIVDPKDIVSEFCSKFQKTERTFWNQWKEAKTKWETLQLTKEKDKADAIHQKDLDALKQGLKSKEERQLSLQNRIDEIEKILQSGTTPDAIIDAKSLTSLDIERKLTAIERANLMKVHRELIAELNKMDGSYAPAETKTTITDTRPPAKVKLPDGTEIEI